MTLQFFTSVLAACDTKLAGQPELLVTVQDFVLPLVDVGPGAALRVGGKRLLSLWLEVAAIHGAGIDEYTGAAMFAALQQSGEAFLDRALTASVRPQVWTSVANFAVRNNNRALLQMLDARVHSLSAPNALEIATDVGDLSLVQWIHETGFGASVATDKTLARAAGKANLEVIQWFITTYKLPKKDAMVRRAMNHAAMYGQSEILDWLREHTDVWWSPHAIGAALCNGHYELADRMFDHNTERRKTYAFEVDDRSPPTIDVTEVMCKAFTKGDLRLLDWLRNRELLPAISNRSTDRAKKAGHVHVLDYVVKHDPNANDALHFSPLCAAGGSIAVAQWALARGVLSTSAKVVTTAARNGHLAFMQWYTTAMHGQIVPDTDFDALAITVSRGHFECARFLVDNNYAHVTSIPIIEAASNGHLAITQWLVSVLRLESLENQAYAGELTERRRLQCLGTAMNQAALNGHLDVVKWIFGMQLFPCTDHTIGGAARNGHLDVVQFLLKDAPEHAIHRAAVKAAARGHLQIVKFVLSHAPQNRDTCDELVRRARRNDHNDIARWIEAYGCKAHLPDNC